VTPDANAPSKFNAATPNSAAFEPTVAAKTLVQATSATPIPAEIIRNVRRIEIVTRRMVNEVMAGSYHSTFKGQGMEFEEVREYTHGDDVRTIDWNVTARTGAPHVKRFREERELTVAIAVDLSGSTAFGTRQRLKAELAAEVSALLAFSAIRNNDRVGLLVFSDHIERWIPPKKGRNHVLRVTREILAHKPTGRKTDYQEASSHLIKTLRRKSVVFLISDFLSDDFARPLTILNKKHDLVALMVRDPREETLPAVGIAQFLDPETGESITVDTTDANFRRRYEAIARAARNRAISAFRESQVDHAELRTDRPYIDPIVSLFRRRATRF
jgi:uncharacterized protein (DUF58 family)